MTAPSPKAYRRAALAAGRRALGGRRLVFVGWAMPGEREMWAADALAFDDARGLAAIASPIKPRRRRARRRPR